jgi:hypothetical protein
MYRRPSESCSKGFWSDLEREIPARKGERCPGTASGAPSYTESITYHKGIAFSYRCKIRESKTAYWLDLLLSICDMKKKVAGGDSS